MDAERLIDMSRHALAQSRAVPDVVAEAWQGQALAQAVGGWLAVHGPLELRGDARGLGEIGGQGLGSLDHPGVRGSGIRASLLSGVADPRGALTRLGALLGDVGIALVGVACATDEEGLYWQCIEAMDAADESNDRVRAMLRRLAAKDLAARDAGRRPGTIRERAGPVREGPAGDGRVRDGSGPPGGAAGQSAGWSAARGPGGGPPRDGARSRGETGASGESSGPARDGLGPARDGSGPAREDGPSATERPDASEASYVPRPPPRPGGPGELPGTGGPGPGGPRLRSGAVPGTGGPGGPPAGRGPAEVPDAVDSAAGPS